MTSLKSFNPSPPKNILAITEITSTTRTKSQPFTKEIQPLAKKCQPLPKEISTPSPLPIKNSQTSLKIIQHLLKTSQPPWKFLKPLEYFSPSPLKFLNPT